MANMHSSSSSSNLVHWGVNAPLQFDIIECGKGGDCLFYTLAQALFLIDNVNVDMIQLRKWMASTIKPENIREFCQEVCEEQKHYCPSGALNFELVLKQYCQHPNILSIIRQIVQRPGWTFQGTDGSLRWLLHHHPHFFNKGFVIFSSWGFDHTQVIKTSKSRDYILLFNNAHTSHWQLASMSGYCGIEWHLVDLILSLNTNSS